MTLGTSCIRNPPLPQRESWYILPRFHRLGFGRQGKWSQGSRNDIFVPLVKLESFQNPGYWTFFRGGSPKPVTSTRPHATSTIGGSVVADGLRICSQSEGKTSVSYLNSGTCSLAGDRQVDLLDDVELEQLETGRPAILALSFSSITMRSHHEHQLLNFPVTSRSRYCTAFSRSSSYSLTHPPMRNCFLCLTLSTPPMPSISCAR